MSETTSSRRAVLGALLAGTTVLAGCSGTDSSENDRRGSTVQPQTTSTDATRAATTTDRLAPELTVSAPDRRVDRAIPVEIGDAEPGSDVTVTVTTEDVRGREWSFETTLAADEDGVLDLGTDGPGVDVRGDRPAMGWWTGATGATDYPYYPPRDGPVSVEITARTDRYRGSTTIQRQKRADGVTDRKIDHPDIVGGVFEPPGDGPHPPVLVLHGSGGRPLYRRARLLASNGYAAAALQYFGDPDVVPDALSEVPLEYFDAAAGWLRDRDGVRDGPVGVLGTSKGGELSLLLGARREWVGAVVGYVPSGLVWQDISTTGTPTSSWTDGGEPIPYLETRGFAGEEDGNRRIRDLYENGLEGATGSEIEAATIAVEETDGPILCISGGDDGLWRSTHLSDIAMKRLRDAEDAPSSEHLAYDDAGHLIFPPYRPTAGRRAIEGRLYGGTPEGYARADVGSWPAVLATFDRGLR